MLEVIHSTKLDLQGPWLITKESLLAFDQVFNKEWETLEQKRQNRIDKEVDRIIQEKHPNQSAKEIAALRLKVCDSVENSYGFEKNIKKLVLVLPKDKQVVAPSFEAVFKDLSLKDENVVGFIFSFKCKEIEGELRVPGYPNNLVLNISSSKNYNSSELFAVLSDWVEIIKPPFWQQAWRSFTSYSFHWLIFFVSLYLIGSYAATKSKSSGQAIRDEAIKIIEQGVDSTNHDKALEVLLKLQSGYTPKAQSVLNSVNYTAIIISLLLAIIALSFMPKVVIGIGVGQARIKYWNWWMNFVAWVMPTWLIATYFLPKIQEMIVNIFSP